MQKFDTVDQYMAAIPRDEFRRELERVRALIRSEVPDAQEVINYGIPAFKLDKVVVWFAAFKNHLSLFAAGGTEALAAELTGFKTSKGTIQFTPENPLPNDWIRKVVRSRLAELQAR